MVVTGPLDALFDFEPGKLCLIRNWTQEADGIGNSSVMRFPAGGAPHLVDDFEKDAIAMSFRYVNEQIYLTRESRLPTVFWPRNWCPSFKEMMAAALSGQSVARDAIAVRCAHRGLHRPSPAA